MSALLLLRHAFSLVCGENPEHIWSPGGLLLPCCQRCTGLYVGAFLAVLIHAWRRPGNSGKEQSLTTYPSATSLATQGWLEPAIYSACLLQLALFLYRPVPPGATWLSSLSGTLFGSGVVYFLWPAVEGKFPRANARRMSGLTYAIVMAAAAACIPIIGEHGGAIGAVVLCAFTVAGALTLAALATANVVFCLRCATAPENRQANCHPSRL